MPDLSWTPTKEEQARLQVAGMRTGGPTAMVNTNERGEPIPPDPKSTTRFVVAKWEWKSPSVPAGAIPKEYTAGDRMARLPALTTWIPSKALRAALDESARISGKYGQAGQNVFVHGGMPELSAALDAGTLPRGGSSSR